MPVTTFFRGGFRWDRVSKGQPLTVEWDGSNEQDICDWINATITAWPPSGASSAQGWVEWTASVSNGVATFTGWTGHILYPDQTLTINVPSGDWITEWRFQNGPFVIASAGLWKTTDPHGRPDDVAKVFAPGTVLPWES